MVSSVTPVLRKRPGDFGKVVEIIAPAWLSHLTTEKAQAAIGKLKDRGLSLQALLQSVWMTFRSSEGEIPCFAGPDASF
jgi:hypothetical protein